VVEPVVVVELEVVPEEELVPEVELECVVPELPEVDADEESDPAFEPLQPASNNEPATKVKTPQLPRGLSMVFSWSWLDDGRI
jgi:hypothetical protein